MSSILVLELFKQVRLKKCNDNSNYTVYCRLILLTSKVHYGLLIVGIDIGMYILTIPAIIKHGLKATEINSPKTTHKAVTIRSGLL